MDREGERDEEGLRTCEWPRVRDDGTRARARVYVRARDGGERNLTREWQRTSEKVHAWYAGTQVRAHAPGEYPRHVRVVESVYIARNYCTRKK